MRISITLILLISAFLFGIVSASAVTQPSGISIYAAIQLTNSQTTSYTQNSQIMLTVNSLEYQKYESSNLQNVEFFYGNGTVIPSWLEGNFLNEKQNTNLYDSQNTIYWIRIFPANSFLSADASNDVYIGFASNTVNLFSNTLTGESPLLSPSYGEYDNEANVFSSYWNFAGTSVPSGIDDAISDGSVAFDNGVVIKGSSSASSGENEVSIASTVSTDTIYDFYGSVPTSSSGVGWGWSEYGYTSNPTCGTGYFACSPDIFTEYTLGSGGIYLYDSFGGTQTTNQYGSTGYINGMFSFALTSNSYYAYENYSTIRVSATSTSTISSGTMYFAAGLGNNAGSYASNGATIYYIRSRYSLPGGAPSAQPSNAVAFASIGIANALVSNSIDVVIGSASDNALITATCSSGDTCSIYDTNGLELASGTTTATLPYNALQSGYSSVYANDITYGGTSANVEVRRIYEANSLRLTFTNSQPTAIPGNDSIIVAFNALAYNLLESNTLNNTAIAFKNGTVAYSWLEGNVLGEENPASELIGSQNVTYWFKTPPSNSFLGPDTGNVVTNSVFLVFGPTSNDLLDGNFIGEAPQLSCPSGTPSTCAGGTYAEYDNGASLFTYYTNFAGTTVPSGWNTAETASLTVDNGISFTGAGTGGAEAQMTMNAAYSRPISMDVLSEVIGSDPVYDLGYVNTQGVFSSGYQVSGAATSQFNVYIDTSGNTPRNTQPVASATVVASIWNVVTLGIGALSVHDEVAYAPFSSYNDTEFNNYYPMFGSWWNDKTVHAQWFRLRDTYDSNVSLAAPQVTPPTATPPTISLADSSGNTIKVVEGSSTDNAFVTANCYPADICQVDNANGMVMGSGTTSAKIAYNSLALGNSTLYANDITAGFISNSVYVDRVPPASMTSLSPATQTVQQAQTATISGKGIEYGLSPYTYQWYESYNGVPTATLANAIAANSILGTGASSGNAQSQNATFVTNSLTSIGTYWFKLYGTDSTPTTVNSTGVNVTVVAPSSVSGGGPQSYGTTLSDNIGSKLGSASSVITATVDGESIGYNQDELPATITTSTRGVNLTFACSVYVNGSTYVFANQVQGVGFGLLCGQSYYASGSSIIAMYSLSANAVTSMTSTSTSTTSTTSASTTDTTTALPVSTIVPPHNVVINVPGNESSVKACSATAETSYEIGYASIGSTFTVSPNAEGCFTLNAVNLTLVAHPSISGFTPLLVINVSITAVNATIGTTMNYSCGIPSSSVGPYILRNTTWDEITPFTLNQSACTLSFTIPDDPEIAILESNGTQPITTTVNQTSTQQPAQASLLLPAFVAVVIVLLVIWFIVSKRRHKKKVL